MASSPTTYSPSSSTTLNGRLAPIHSMHPGVQRHVSQGSPTSPLLRTRTPIDTPAPFPIRRTLHPGCVLCGYVASANATSYSPSSSPSSPVNATISLPSPIRSSTPELQRGFPSSQQYNSPISPSAASTSSTTPLRPLHLLQQREAPIVSGHRIIYRDAFLTVFPAEGKEALCPNGRHIVLVLNTHLQSVYELGAGDVPILSHILKVATTLLLETSAASDIDAERGFTAKDVAVGFVNGMPRDPRFPYPHLHAQAFLGPFDKNLPGTSLWRRNVVYGSLNWWSIDDLRAEIREETSNNRVKSGYDDRLEAPIDKVPDAGAVDGLPNAMDPNAYSNGTQSDHNAADFARLKGDSFVRTSNGGSPTKLSSPTKSASPTKSMSPTKRSSISAKDRAQRIALLRIDSDGSARTVKESRDQGDYGPDNSSISSTDTR